MRPPRALFLWSALAGRGSRWALLGLLVVGGLTAACTGDPAPVVSDNSIIVITRPTNTPTPTPMSSPTPTATPTPSNTPPPTNTPTPTPTAIPTLTPPPTDTPTATPSPDPRPQTISIGVSVRNQPIEVVRFGAGPRALLLIGGIHAGFAPATVSLAERVIAMLREQPSLVPPSLTVYVLPNLNVDSLPDVGEFDGRLNANRVDLNRNWECRWTADPSFRRSVRPGAGGTAPLSEPETAALSRFIDALAPVGVIMWGARYEGGLVSPGHCDNVSRASLALAGIYAAAAGYTADDYELDTGQLVNGDFTNSLDARGIPAVAVLLPDYTDMDLAANLRAVRAVLSAYE